MKIRGGICRLTNYSALPIVMGGPPKSLTFQRIGRREAKGKHARRVFAVRCNATNLGVQPPFIYKAGKYEYPFPKDDLKRTLVAQAIEAYREDNELPENVVVTTTESTIQNR